MNPAQPVAKSSKTHLEASTKSKNLWTVLTAVTGVKAGKHPGLSEYWFNAVFFSAGALMMIGVFH